MQDRKRNDTAAKPQSRAMLCPGCRRLINRDEPACPHCGLKRPGSWWNRIFQGGSDNADQMARAIIYANIGMYVLSLLLNPVSVGLSRDPFRFLSPSRQSLFFLGATGTIPIGQYNRWWTLISANYLHGGVLHIAFNLIAFRQLASLTLQEYGAYRMISIYTLGGAIGFLISTLAGVPFTIGASAAICSLIGSAIYYGKSRGGTYGQALYKQLGGWAIGIFVFGLIVPGINNWAHGGGFLAGIAAAHWLGYRERRGESLFHRWLGIACVVGTGIILLWAVASSFVFLFLRPLVNG
jgi:rhomboid protease GluP